MAEDRGPNPVRYVVLQDPEGPGYMVVEVTRVVMEFGHTRQTAQSIAFRLQAEADADWNGAGS